VGPVILRPVEDFELNGLIRLWLALVKSRRHHVETAHVAHEGFNFSWQQRRIALWE
jgi:hypothetical protein